VGVSVLRTAAFALTMLLVAAASGHAQIPPPSGIAPPPGFVPPYEIMRTVRAAGFQPMAPPLREGSTYVLRATDFRGILMRVVVDARTAVIRDVTRIVPGPGRYGQYYAAPPYGEAELDAPTVAPSEAGIEPPSVRPPVAHLTPAPNPTVTARPPLPRPRPAALASRKADDANPPAKSQPLPSAKSGANTGAGVAPVAKPAGAPDARSQINSEVITTAPPPPAPRRMPGPAEPLND
jgi:hypothetical protein